MGGEGKGAGVRGGDGMGEWREGREGERGEKREGEGRGGKHCYLAPAFQMK